MFNDGYAVIWVVREGWVGGGIPNIFLSDHKTCQSTCQLLSEQAQCNRIPSQIVQAPPSPVKGWRKKTEGPAGPGLVAWRLLVPFHLMAQVAFAGHDSLSCFPTALNANGLHGWCALEEWWSCCFSNHGSGDAGAYLGNNDEDTLFGGMDFDGVLESDTEGEVPDIIIHCQLLCVQVMKQLISIMFPPLLATPQME